MSNPGPTVAEIKAAALSQVRAIADRLAPDMATIDGHRRWSLNPTRPDTQPNSFCVDIAGPAPGRFMEFSGGTGGDVIDFVSYCLGGEGGYQSPDRRGQAIRWLKSFLGFEAMGEGDRQRFADLARRRDEQRAKTEHQAKAKRESNARFAKELWIKARPWEGSLVETYLVEARGLPVRDIGSPLHAIRFEPEALDGQTGEILPAMLTAFTNARGQIRGVHTTFLEADGSGKAKIERAKRFLGDVRGSAMRLHRGSSGKPERDRPLRSDVLAIAEGIENALSWSCLYPDHRTFAAGAVDMIPSVPIPECADRLIILRDNDAPDSPADKALGRASMRLCERAGGVGVSTQAPPPAFKDFNDYWRACTVA